MSFYSKVIQKDPRFHSPNACYDPALLFPPFRAVVEAIIHDALVAGYTLHIGETFRSEARQQMLFAKGLTQIRQVGVHNFGLAADLILMVNGRYDPVGTHYEFLVDLCAKRPCPWGPTVSGIDWGQPDRPHSFRDYDHIQGVILAQQPALFAGTFYPA